MQPCRNITYKAPQQEQQLDWWLCSHTERTDAWRVILDDHKEYTQILNRVIKQVKITEHTGVGAGMVG